MDTQCSTYNVNTSGVMQKKKEAFGQNLAKSFSDIIGDRKDYPRWGRNVCHRFRKYSLDYNSIFSYDLKKDHKFV